jgi:hypothetical protein
MKKLLPSVSVFNGHKETLLEVKQELTEACRGMIMTMI